MLYVVGYKQTKQHSHVIFNLNFCPIWRHWAYEILVIVTLATAQCVNVGLHFRDLTS